MFSFMCCFSILEHIAYYKVKKRESRREIIMVKTNCSHGCLNRIVCLFSGNGGVGLQYRTRLEGLTDLFMRGLWKK